VKWFGRTFGLPSKYAEEILRVAKVDFDTLGSSLTDDKTKEIVAAAKTLTQKVMSGNHEPVIVKSKDSIDVYPIILNAQDSEYERIPSFMEGLDKVFSKILLEKGRDSQSSSLDKKINDIQSRIDEQDKAILQVKDLSGKISSVAKSLFGLSSSGITTIVDPAAAEMLKSQNAEIVKEKGLDYIKIDGEKIQIRTDASIPAIASTLFDESKRQSSAIASIESLKAKNQKELAKIKSQSLDAKGSVSFTQIRKKNWFERYRWFYTSDGFLAIGGRDSSSNSAIIRKHLEKNDKVFHAEIFGSPFFILKDVPESIPFDSLNEVAHATACFSRAWREAMYGVSAYWINPDQVKKAAPSGQFLSRGSFVLEGQKNFVKVPNLRLAVGILQRDGYHLITCGPPEPIKNSCLCYAIIEPGDSEMPEVAKRIRLEFIKLNEDVAKHFTIDDYVRVLPAGGSRVVDIGLSKLEPKS
ncbi:MAG TPA: NFACT RNA binding domain-containing protein, partial [Candidatus Nitrosotenuis sp.]|nr:NFACT RNA binding domain-containing protein [Candidatus Nitrosotenuis sp.]